jgi:hypothetical protein
MKNIQFLCFIIIGIFVFVSITQVYGQPQKKYKIPTTTEEVINASDIIIVGKVVDIHCEYIKNNPKLPHFIVSFIKIKCSNILKGEPTDTITICTAGGKIGNDELCVSTATKITLSEQVLVHLVKEKDDENYYNYVAEHKKYTVRGNTLIDDFGRKTSLQQYINKVKTITEKQKTKN